MIRLLKAFAEWLDRRFPAKVTVTAEKWEEITRKHIETHARMVMDDSERVGLGARVTQVEKSIAAIKDLLIKQGNPTLSAESRRAEFIKAGRMGE